MMRTKFHQNRPSFMADIIWKTFWSFFLDTLYITVLFIVKLVSLLLVFLFSLLRYGM